MPTTEAEATLTAIANAIRSKSGGGTTPIPVQGTGGFAERIKMIPRPATDNVGKVVVTATEQTQAQMNTNKYVRLNGWPAFETPAGGTVGATLPIEARFRRAEWQIVRHPPTVGTLAHQSALPSVGYSRVFQVGDKLYGGGQTTSTIIPVINTRTGEITQITGLASRQHSGFCLVGTKLYCFSSYNIGGETAYNIVYRINTTNDTVITITLAASRPWNNWMLLGNRLYIGWGGSSTATDIAFINTNDDVPGTTTGLPAAVWGGREVQGQHERPGQVNDCMFATSTKLYISTTTANTIIAVITASGGTAPNYTTWTVSTITGLPSRLNTSWFFADPNLYVGSITLYTQILCIQTNLAANTTTQLSTGATTRANNAFVRVGNNVYVGTSDTSNGARTTVIPVVNNTTRTISLIEGLPEGRYSRLIPISATKLYALGETSTTTLIVINPTNNTWSEVTGLPNQLGMIDARNTRGWYLDGANLYLLNRSSGANYLVLNTTNETVRATITGILSGWTARDFLTVPVSRANPEGGMYVTGSATGEGAIMEIDFASVNERGSGASVRCTQIRGIPSVPGANDMFFGNEKIWLAGSQTATTQITCLTKSVLPTHAGFAYVRY